MAVNFTATVSGLEAANGHELLRHWWQWVGLLSDSLYAFAKCSQVLLSVGIAAILTGASYLITIICQHLWRSWLRKVRVFLCYLSPFMPDTNLKDPSEPVIKPSLSDCLIPSAKIFSFEIMPRPRKIRG